jgi:arsenite methyltransferase
LNQLNWQGCSAKGAVFHLKQDHKENDMKDTETIREQIRSDYASIATSSTVSRDQLTGENVSSGSCCSAGACGVTESIDPADLAEQIGYSREELEALPSDANMGLSCGNPTVIAQLKEGETLLDLGSGGGFDVFLAGPKVGEQGRAIGVDMTSQMISKARTNIEHYQQTTGLDNVEFRLGEIEHLPVADNSVDVIISNCVLNLSLDKQQVWNEIARVLKPGGRVAVSDIALLKPLPTAVKDIVESWAGCVAGAIEVETMRAQMENAGLTGVSLSPKPDYVRALTAANDPLYTKVSELLDEGESACDVITSVDIVARKPDGCGCTDGCCS